MLIGLDAFFTYLTLLFLFTVITSIRLCYLAFRNYRHEDVDISIADVYDDNDLAYEMECNGNPNVEVKINCIILTLAPKKIKSNLNHHSF